MFIPFVKLINEVVVFVSTVLFNYLIFQAGFSSSYDFSFQSSLLSSIRPRESLNSTCGSQAACQRCFPVAPWVFVIYVHRLCNECVPNEQYYLYTGFVTSVYSTNVTICTQVMLRVFTQRTVLFVHRLCYECVLFVHRLCYVPNES